ncbi:gliding motility-associated C-terminal domain-containing protein [Mucilaginibacter antarcticus]|uniref:gliding motility-associated C-terminal domain-containing protein n=1 Tax=Mucilaginibacter antarcticus TaxID=1855725 RepID=UPI00362F902F
MDKQHPGIGLVADGIGTQISSFTATNNTDLPVVATITVIPVNNSTCEGLPIYFTITVENDPALTVSTISGDITGCLGVASGNPQQFVISGRHLKDDVIVTAPAGFEVSTTTERGFRKEVKLLRLNGVLASTTVYIRSADNAALGANNGTVTITSLDAPDETLLVSSFVNATPVVNAVANQQVKAKALVNPITFKGTADRYTWTNSTPSIGLAASGIGDIAAFEAINVTGEPVTAVINVVPVNTAGCNGAIMSFSIVVEPTEKLAVILPNTFTPNGDGINDTWVIENLNQYPKAVVKVFNRLGSVVFYSQGYPQPWNGRSGSTNLPVGSYYYLIDTKEEKVFSGYLSIIR